MTERETFEYFRLALLAGVLNPAEIVAWAESMVAQHERPSGAVCELASLSREVPAKRLVLILREASDSASHEKSSRCFLALLERLLSNGTISPPEAMWAVSVLPQHGALPESDSFRLTSYIDDYDLAVGSDTARSDVVARFRAELVALGASPEGVPFAA